MLNMVKTTEKFPTLWRNDTERLKGIVDYINYSAEKNFTSIVLKKIDEKQNILKFLQGFKGIGPKTSAFYMKFIRWIFELELSDLPIAVDQHVFRSLICHRQITSENYDEAVRTIKKIALELNVSPIDLETALYEASH